MPTEVFDVPAWMRRYLDSEDDDKDLFRFLPDKVAPKLDLIFKANKILEEYAAQGYQLTLRQLYYQFVARGLIANNDRNYKKLGDAVVDGRMWGIIDWEHLVDRGRVYQRRPHWENPAEIIASAAHSFRLDRWRDSEHRVEVWVEKQALEEVIQKACEPFDVGYIACKGYMSISEMWAAAQRLEQTCREDQQAVVIYLGDHDPSGIDMSRDIQDRLNTFHCYPIVRRLALNMDQVEEHDPPPNPAKITDSRAADYIERFGHESWELDALEPKLLVQMITEAIEDYTDEAYHDRAIEEHQHKQVLEECSDRWDDVVKFLLGDD